MPSSNVVAAARSNGAVELKKPSKKRAKEDEVAKFLANSDDSEQPKVQSDDETLEDKDLDIEAEYLKEQNLKHKMQLLEDSSESEQNYDDSDDSDYERKING